MRKAVIITLLVSLLGLAFFQYQLFSANLILAKSQFDQQIAATLQSLESDLVNKNQLTHLIRTTLRSDSTLFRLPYAALKDTTDYFLTDFLKYKLEINGINARFQYEIVNMKGVPLLQSIDYQVVTKNYSSYRVSLSGYLTTDAEERYFLQLDILNLPRYLLTQLNDLFVPNFIFLILIIICSIWLIRVLYWEKRLNRTTQNFINNLTHELKTPVFSIALASKILQEKLQNEGDLKWVEMIRFDNEKLKNHIEKILSLANLEKRKSVLDLQLIDFQGVINKIKFYWSIKIEQQGGNFYLESPPNNQAIWLRADEGHLLSVFDNILDNAVKYSPDTLEISMTVRVEGRSLVVQIADKGIGMTKKAAKKAFEKFYRVPETDNLHRVKGFGVGLSYARQVVQLHKGRIRLDSTPNQGTTVWIELPIQKNGQI